MSGVFRKIFGRTLIALILGAVLSALSMVCKKIMSGGVGTA